MIGRMKNRLKWEQRTTRGMNESATGFKGVRVKLMNAWNGFNEMQWINWTRSKWTEMSEEWTNDDTRREWSHRNQSISHSHRRARSEIGWLTGRNERRAQQLQFNKHFISRVEVKLKLVEWIASGIREPLNSINLHSFTEMEWINWWITGRLVNGVNLIQWNTPIQSYLIEWCDFMNFINNIITVREGNER